METTPVSLLERLRKPADEQAWGRFVDLYTPLLFHWARRTGIQDADAADLIQDVFQVLVQKLPDFAYDQSQPRNVFLRTVLLNQWRTKLGFDDEREKHGCAFRRAKSRRQFGIISMNHSGMRRERPEK